MIKLSKPYIPPDSYKNVMEVLKSGQLVQGKYVRLLEEWLKGYLDIDYAVVVSSGTAALHLALITLDIKRGDEVIIPAFSFPATANVVELCGAIPVFVDIQLEDFCINASLIEKKITRKTKAIICVHEFGQSAQIDTILRIARKHRLKVIEDSACSLGTRFKNQPTGTFGDIGCFSFHPRKTLTTGEGGALITAHKSIAKKASSLRNHGITIKNNKQNFILPGLNYRLTDFQAALGYGQLKYFENLIEKRIQIAQLYDTQLRDISGIHLPANLPGKRMTYQTYFILLDASINRDSVISRLRTFDIETNIGAHCIPSLQYYREKYDHSTTEFPKAWQAFSNGLALPMSAELKPRDIKHVTSTLKKLLMPG